MSQLHQDLRGTLRSMTRRPGLTLAAVLTIALGISANTVIFSVLEAVLLHPVPFRDAERIAYARVAHPQWGPGTRINPSPPMTRSWAHGAPSLEDVEIYSPVQLKLDDGEQVWGERISSEMFAFLGVRPRLGRGPSREEASSEAPVVVLSHAFWQRRLGGESNVLGQSVVLFGKPHTVIGVLPSEIRFLEPERMAHLWLPFDPLRARDDRKLSAVVRLRPSAQEVGAAAELDALIPEGFRIDRMYTVLMAPTDLFGQVPKLALALQIAVACVLLIACVNVAQLLLALGEGRAREMAMRSVLGAGRSRLVRQLLTESLALSVSGGLLAVFLSHWSLETLVALLPEALGFLGHLEVNGYVLGFTAGAAMVSGLIFGLVPALRSSSPHLSTALKKSSGHGGGPRARHMVLGLVTLQIALSLALLAGAGGLINTFVRWQQLGFGFDTNDLLMLSFKAKYETYEEPAQRLALADQIVSRIAAGPVDRVTLARTLPAGDLEAFAARPEAEDGRSSSESVFLSVVPVGAEFFTRLGIKLIHGRDFQQRDRDGAEKVVIVNQALAGAYWGERNPVGRRFRLGPSDDWSRVVGVLPDVRYRGLELRADEPLAFRPFAQAPTNQFEVSVFSSADSAGVLADLQARLADLPPDVELISAQTFADRIRPQFEVGRFHALLAVIFAALAVVLSAIGIHGVMAHSVIRRRREIGVRMAMGAEHAAMVALMVRGGVAPLVFGVALGLAGAAALLRVLHFTVHEAIKPWDSALVMALAIGVCLVAWTAVWFPARAATRVEPSEILRHDQ